MAKQKFTWSGFFLVYIGLFFMTNPVRLEALNNWNIILVAFLVYIVGAALGSIGIYKEQQSNGLKITFLIGVVIGIIIIGSLMASS